MNLFSKSSFSLMNKIMFAFMAYFMMILIVFSVLILVIENGQIKSLSNEYTRTISNEKAAAISIWLDERVSNIKLLAATSEVQSFEAKRYLPLLENILSNSDGIYGRYYVINEAMEMVDTLGIKKDLSDDQDVIATMKNAESVIITQAVYDETLHQPTFRVMVPIIVDGKVKGVIGSTVLLKELGSMVEFASINDKGYVWIVDNNGMVITHKDDHKVLKFNINEADNEGYSGLIRLSESMQLEDEGVGIFKDDLGNKEYVTFSRIKSSPNWELLITMYASNINTRVFNLMRYLVLLFIILSGISIIVSYMLAKDITTSIKTLIEVMRKFTSGIKGIRAKVEGKDEIGILSESFNAMADTIVAHTENVEELIKERTQTLAELNYQIVSRNKELGTMNEELEKTNNKLHELASIDMLTGLYNRHQFQRELQKTIELVNTEDEKNFALLFIDLDNFKYYNDTFSHEIGDFLLQEVAGILTANVRDNDLVGRYGGDEFVILLREGDYQVAKTIAERMHTAILSKEGFKKELAKKLSADVKIMGKNKLSSSIGIVNYMKSLNISTAEDLLALADETMYKAKKSGKSRVVVN